MSELARKRKQYLAATDRVKIGPIFITRYERARIIGARAMQLSFQAMPLVEVPPDVTDPMRIAALELDGDALPITVRRHLPSGNYQDIPVSWLVNEY
jgi:DNA-directed RNA polymerase subunit K/omega